MTKDTKNQWTRHNKITNFDTTRGTHQIKEIHKKFQIWGMAYGEVFTEIVCLEIKGAQCNWLKVTSWWQKSSIYKTRWMALTTLIGQTLFLIKNTMIVRAYCMWEEARTKCLSPSVLCCAVYEFIHTFTMLTQHISAYSQFSVPHSESFIPWPRHHQIIVSRHTLKY